LYSPLLRHWDSKIQNLSFHIHHTIGICLEIKILNVKFLYKSMAYRLVLTAEKEQSVLILFENGVERARRDWGESRDMGRRAFESIEEVLREAGIGPEAVMSFQVISELPDSSTSRRIAETVASVYTFGVQSTAGEEASEKEAA